MSRIERVEIIPFTFDVHNMGLGGHGGAGVGNVEFERGGTFTASRFAVRLKTDDGATGSYVAHWVATPSSLGQALMLAPALLGRDPARREQIYDDLKREVRAYDHMGHGVLDIALWDLIGKQAATPVKSLLGGFRDRLPAYASTYHGQESGGGLDSPAAYAQFAKECVARGLAGFKIHGWHNGDVARECETIRAVREAVGPDVAVMIDPACEIRTWHDTLTLGLACDANNLMWLEDPFRDGGKAAMGHQRLREKIRTPLLLAEHIRSPELKANFILSGACDIVHIDPEYDLGITGAMKLAHFCELLGLDVQLHACGPAHRACMSAIRNTHYYELALIGPEMPNIVAPVYTDGYSDQLDDLAADGCVPVPDGPGLGVSYDWDYIEANATARHTFTA